MESLLRPSPWGQTVVLAVRGLRTWTARHILTALASALGLGLLLGVATVLIPNPVFGRDIAPVWWNYPVWLLTSAFSGMLIATYVGGDRAPRSDDPADEWRGAERREEVRGSRLGLAGGVLAWFAVGCPVCNKIALLALGYSGAITWFAPVQPVMALVALALTAVALLWRLRGLVACPAPSLRAAGAAR